MGFDAVYTPPPILRQIKNGATLLVIQDEALPVVHFIVALRHGAIADPKGRTGCMKTMVELMLRGTESLPRDAFSMRLERLGTGIDTVVGVETALFRVVCLKRHFRESVELLAQALHTPAFDAAEFEKLVEETIEGHVAERDDDDTVADIFLRRHLYANHPFERSPAGEVADLETLQLSDVRLLHRQIFNPKEMVLAFAGDITPEEAQQASDLLLQGFPTDSRPVVSAPEFHEPQGTRILVVDKPERTQVQLRLATTTVPGTSRAIYPCWLGVTGFGGTFTSVFCREVRDVRGWSYVAAADVRRRTRYTSPLLMRSAPQVADAIDCLELELKLFADLAEGRFEEGALELARSYLLNRYPFEVQSGPDMLFAAVQNELLGLDPDEIARIPALLADVRFDSVEHLFRSCLQPNRLTAVLVATADGLLAPLRERFPNTQINVIDYKDGARRSNDAPDAEELESA